MSSFITHALLYGWGTDSGNANLFGNNTGSNFLTNGDSSPGCDWNPIPAVLTLERLAIRVSAAPGTNFTFQATKGIPRTPMGSTVVLLSGQQSAEGNIGVTASQPVVVGDLSTEAFGWNGTSAGGSINGRTMWKYSLASPFDKYNIIASGFSNTVFFNSTATRFLAINSPVSSSVETSMQSAIVIPGTFKYLLVVILNQVGLIGPPPTAGDSTYTATLNINGSPAITITGLNNSTSTAFGLNTTTSAAVVSGDLVDFSFTTSGPFDTDHRGRVYAAVGFLPS
jgi:hypothetical protein